MRCWCSRPFALYPLVLILRTALKPEPPVRAASTWATSPTAWEQGRFGTYLTTSVVVSVSVVAATVVLSSLAAYAFATMTFRGSGVLFYLLLLGLMVPSDAIIVPLYYDLESIGLTNTYAALILPQVAQSLAFGTFWMRAYFRSADRAIIEAARLDGAGHGRVLWSVLLPMGRPAVVTMMLLVFMWTWNEFLLPLVMVTDESLRTAPLGLAFFKGQYTAGTSLLAAGAVLVALPVLVLYLVAQRHFIRGMVDGSLKG